MVWVGGVALALGGIFLVRYTIQQGLIGPGVRIFLGALLALALVAAGEWSRRTEKLSALAGVPSAHIPGTLTAAGTTVAYATVYAAYALYGFLPPAAAFILLGAVALLTLGAALLHGPALAGLGVIGAYLAPMLVASAEPDFWSLYIYIAVVNAAAFALARFRMWRWLAIAAIVLGALWTLPGTQPDTVTALGAHVFHALAGFALVATFLVCGLVYGPPAAPGAIDRLSTLALVVYLLVAALLVLASRHDPVALTAFVVLTVATVAIAWRTEAAAGAVPAAAVLAAAGDGALGGAHECPGTAGAVRPGGAGDPGAGALRIRLAPDPRRRLGGAVRRRRIFGARPLVARAGADAVERRGSVRAARHAGRALLSHRAARSLAAVRGAGAARRRDLCARDRDAGEARAAARPDGGGRDVRHRHARRAGAGADLRAGEGLAHHRAGADGAGHRLDRGTAAAALAALACRHHGRRGGRARRLTNRRIAGADLGTTPIFNWLLYGYGVPAAAFWVAGWLLRRRADDLPARMVDAGAILFTVLLAVLEIRHYVTGGNIYRLPNGVVEAMLYVNVGLAMTIGLERVRGRTGSIVHNAARAIDRGADARSPIIADLLFAWGPRFDNIRSAARSSI